jgi:hypothetical protein
MIPTNRPFSTTGNRRKRPSFIICLASSSVCPGAIVIGFLVIHRLINIENASLWLSDCYECETRNDEVHLEKGCGRPKSLIPFRSSSACLNSPAGIGSIAPLMPIDCRFLARPFITRLYSRSTSFLLKILTTIVAGESMPLSPKESYSLTCFHWRQPFTLIPKGRLPTRRSDSGSDRSRLSARPHKPSCVARVRTTGANIGRVTEKRVHL